MDYVPIFTIIQIIGTLNVFFDLRLSYSRWVSKEDNMMQPHNLMSFIYLT